MLYMERDQSAVTDLPFTMELAGRRNGKGRRAAGAVQDEMAQRRATLDRRRLDRAQAKRYLAARKRRYEFTNRPKTRPSSKVHCPHVEQRWTQVPHPRYGSAQPFFRAHLVPVTRAHDCVYGAI